jgi:membrane protease YdiL (CAAX protease family)
LKEQAQLLNRQSSKLIASTFLASWIPWLTLAAINIDEKTSHWLYFVGGLGPVFGFLISHIHDRRKGYAWKNPFTVSKSPIFFISLLPLVSFLPVLLSGLIGSLALQIPFDEKGWNASISEYGGFFLFALVIFIGGPLTEELSWHGYLWPRLRTLHGMTRSVVNAGSVWTMWHLPLFFIQGTSQNSNWTKGGFLIFFAISCYLQMWLWGLFYEISGFGVYSAIFAHYFLNLSSFIVLFDWRLRAIEMTLYLSAILFLYKLNQGRVEKNIAN